MIFTRHPGDYKLAAFVSDGKKRRVHRCVKIPADMVEVTEEFGRPVADEDGILDIRYWGLLRIMPYHHGVEFVDDGNEP